MVKINRIYTRTGDDGNTHLVDGTRCAKDSLRVSAYGDVDELNSVIGMARTLAEARGFTVLNERLSILQNELFDAGSLLACPAEMDLSKLPMITNEQVTRLEHWIDECTEQLEELKSFVFPGGDELNAWLHLARTVCRRAERSIVTLSHRESVPSPIAIFFNRLSDLLFAWARLASKNAGTKEYLWVPNTKVPPTDGRKA